MPEFTNFEGVDTIYEIEYEMLVVYDLKFLADCVSSNLPKNRINEMTKSIMASIKTLLLGLSIF